MNDAKYIGLDVHQATISAVVFDSAGRLPMESILETKAATILQFVQGLRGSLYVTFEEGTCAHWLHDLLKPHVSRVVVCDPRKNALLKARATESMPTSWPIFCGADCFHRSTTERTAYEL
jgi:transposase